jgi:heat shock protein HslJ
MHAEMPLLMTRKSPLFALCIGLALSLLAGCAANPDQVAETTQAVTAPNQLVTSSWTAERIFAQTADATESTVIFNEDGTVNGSTGCNNYQGAVDINGTAMGFGLLATTRKMCEPAVSGQEIVFLEALGSVHSWHRMGSTLELLDENNTVVIRLVQNDS